MKQIKEWGVTHHVQQGLGRVGGHGLDILRSLGAPILLFIELINFLKNYFLFERKFTTKPLMRRKILVAEIHRLGAESLPVVLLVLFFVGVVLALQMVYILKLFGVTEFVGTVVGVGMFRELGPLITGIVMSGQMGASIAAELGTMAVSEEIEALKTVAIHPLRYLVLPRVFAAILMVPMVTLIADIVGIIGGQIIAFLSMGISPALYFQKAFSALIFKDLFSGIFKSAVFGLIISLVACSKGLSVREGAREVGLFTTSAVVSSIVLIILADCFFTLFFYFILDR